MTPFWVWKRVNCGMKIPPCVNILPLQLQSHQMPNLQQELRVPPPQMSNIQLDLDNDFWNKLLYYTVKLFDIKICHYIKLLKATQINIIMSNFKKWPTIYGVIPLFFGVFILHVLNSGQVINYKILNTELLLSVCFNILW
jgi:hypothetical protein